MKDAIHLTSIAIKDKFCDPYRIMHGNTILPLKELAITVKIHQN